MNSVILRAGARLQVVLLLVFSAYMLLRGHNAPGGGFIGGLIAATGFVVYAIACGTADARKALRFDPGSIAGAGLGIALIAGLMAVFWGDALFTGQWLFIGATETEKGLPLSTVLVFDIGVYLVVLGAILSITFALEEAV
ncbi:multisubunit sodium/proton antiporter MrpB subunit [Loktanella sp. PT4BL]|jgi:multicomponent Na+:H+ antiporter subunit B|uniref:Na+/H+ antiporter subunit B n=1 Tax=Loktanella sp. PT4BL TaxID=2135611 RepID=UPI0006DCEA2B|nr:Na+/H+ antiporter subunit B [Loktanella sp. PT4BL]KQB98152.1 cation:proton antiporter [Loktanella sp. 1ANDIMAR09]PXW70241.1 multisubunit sodium/proton antiporter MrpB subunit [Loktanella sp. PT4BL]